LPADAGREEGELLKILAVERQILKAMFGDELRNVRGLRLHDLSLGFNGHSIRDAADFERGVQDCRFVDGDRQCFALRAFEAVFFNRQRVHAGRKAGELILAVAVGNRFLRRRGRGVGQSQSRARQRRIAWIADAPAQTAVDADLCKSR